MRALVLRGTKLAVEDVDVPEPGPGQVLARVRACGICGSDLHAAQYMSDMMGGGRGTWYDENPEAPVIMGHEFVAEIAKAGPGAERWAPGTRVTSVPVLVQPDGRVESIGYTPGTPGAYGEYVLMSAPLLLPVPDHVPDLVAATTEPCAVGLHAVREAGLQQGESAFVMGAGPIGLMTLLWLKHEAAAFVAVSDFSPERRALAQKLGADLVIDPSATNVNEALGEALQAVGKTAATPYLSGRALPAPDVVFECVGVEGTLQQAMETVRTHGRVVVAGVCMREDRIRPFTGISRQLTLKFVLGYTPDEYRETLQAFADGAIDTSPMVTRTVTVEQLPQAFVALSNPRDCKVVLVPGV